MTSEDLLIISSRMKLEIERETGLSVFMSHQKPSVFFWCIPRYGVLCCSGGRIRAYKYLVCINHMSIVEEEGLCELLSLFRIPRAQGVQESKLELNELPSRQCPNLAKDMQTKKDLSKYEAKHFTFIPLSFPNHSSELLLIINTLIIHGYTLTICMVHKMSGYGIEKFIGPGCNLYSRSLVVKSQLLCDLLLWQGMGGTILGLYKPL